MTSREPFLSSVNTDVESGSVPNHTRRASAISVEPIRVDSRTFEHFLPLLTHCPPERLCFICLDGAEEDGAKLVSCCSQCYAVTHTTCWKDWRWSQASHARRARVAGSRLASDPFLCSICKSGSARVEDERVTIRWLEAFSNFGQRSVHQVRAASGLFAALTGARGEEVRRSSDNDSNASYDEEDFLDFVETEQELGNRGVRSTFFCGNSKKCIVGNIILFTFFIVGNGIISEIEVLPVSYQVMGNVLLIFAYLVCLAAYVNDRYQRIMNQRQLGS